MGGDGYSNIQFVLILLLLEHDVLCTENIDDRSLHLRT